MKKSEIYFVGFFFVSYCGPWILSFYWAEMVMMVYLSRYFHLGNTFSSAQNDIKSCGL